MISNRQGGHVLSLDEQKSMSVGSEPNGGYLVTPAVSNRVMMIVRESSPLRELATVESITSSELEIPIDEDEAEAQWAGETEARAETTTARVGMQPIPVWESYRKHKATHQFLQASGCTADAWSPPKRG